MSCQFVNDHLCGFLDGDATPVVQIEIEAHLRLCRGCWHLVESCRQTILVYRRQAAPELPAAVHRKLMARLKGRGNAEARPPFGG